MEVKIWSPDCGETLAHHGFSSLLFYTTPGPPAQGWSYPQWGTCLFPHHQLLIKKRLTSLFTGQSDGGTFSNEVPSSQVTLECVNLTKKLAASF